MQQRGGEGDDARVVEEEVGNGEEQNSAESRRCFVEPGGGIVAGRVCVERHPVGGEVHRDRTEHLTLELEWCGQVVEHGVTLVRRSPRPEREEGADPVIGSLPCTRAAIATASRDAAWPPDTTCRTS
jgi:hypothetical protein